MAICIACVALVFAIGMNAAQVRAQQYNLETLLVGKWRQVFGPYVGETVLTASGRYVSVTVQAGTPNRFYCEGIWLIKYGNQLWQYTERCVGNAVISENVRVFAWEATPIQVIDANHLRNKLGDAYRVP